MPVVEKLADSDPIRVGDPVFVVGAPYGLSLTRSTSGGRSSARWDAEHGHSATSRWPSSSRPPRPINAGNSGGPMFTATGQLIGIVSHNITKSGGSEGLGFVVASNTVRKLLIERHRRWYGLDVPAGDGRHG